MTETPSAMLELGTQAPEFILPNMNAQLAQHSVALSDFKGKPLIVVFMCNHCPYVVLVTQKLAELAKKWQQRQVALVAINSNDVDRYPADSPENMTAFAQENDFHFPYVYDESQAVAKAYKAVCTPDFFLFNNEHELVYRGRFDTARPGNGETVSGQDLDNAVTHLLAEKEISNEQMPSVGCSIKWKLDDQAQ